MKFIDYAIAVQDRRQQEGDQLRLELAQAQAQINRLREQLEIAKHLGYTTDL